MSSSPDKETGGYVCEYLKKTFIPKLPVSNISVRKLPKSLDIMDDVEF